MSRHVRVASFDIGSNTVLMLIADLVDDQWVRVEDHMAITRIAEGLDQSGLLRDDAIERTEAALRPMVERLQVCDVTHVLVTGTAPFRRARNGAMAAARLSDLIGHRMWVVTGEQEADLVLAATVAAFPEFSEFVVIDIGGASTEIVSVRGQVRRVSLDIGTVRLTERHSRNGEYGAASIATLREDIGRALAAPEVAELLADAAGLPLVGVAGTVTTLACVHLQLLEWDDNVVHGSLLPAVALRRLADELPAMTVSQRVGLPGMPPKRADVIAAGACLLSELANALHADGVVVSDRGIRWGRLAWEWQRAALA